ncbi:MAG: hypothetical protein Q7K21_07015 [Elusimicrobiota bacterium]|nr:hypothetical protein [Elusimicrobiota bacterium]
MRSVKFTITFPEPLFNLIEQEKKKEKLNRSEFLQKAVSWFYEKMQEKNKIKKYIEAYRKHPESNKEMNTWTMVGLESFNKERW